MPLPTSPHIPSANLCRIQSNHVVNNFTVLTTVRFHVTYLSNYAKNTTLNVLCQHQHIKYRQLIRAAAPKIWMHNKPVLHPRLNHGITKVYFHIHEGDTEIKSLLSSQEHLKINNKPTFKYPHHYPLPPQLSN